MITFKTTTEKPIYDKRQKLVGNYIIYITVQKLEIDANNVLAIGYYYYKNTIDEIENVIKLSDFRTLLTWESIAQIESNFLNPLSTITLKDSVFKRILD